MKSWGTYLLVFLELLVIGCVSTGNSTISHQSNLAQIKEGVSSKSDVQNILGAPNTITPLVGGESWFYCYGKSTTNPASFLPIVGLGVMAAGYGSFNEAYSLHILFDDLGIVRKIKADRYNSKAYLAPFYGKTGPVEHQVLRSTPDSPIGTSPISHPQISPQPPATSQTKSPIQVPSTPVSSTQPVLQDKKQKHEHEAVIEEIEEDSIVEQKDGRLLIR